MWTLKLRELLLDYPRIFSLASDVGMPVLGQGQATGTWECSGHITSRRWRQGDKYLELHPVSIAHLKWAGFHLYKSQNNLEKQTFICLMPLKELLEKLQHWAESTLGCNVQFAAIPAPAEQGWACRRTPSLPSCPSLLGWVAWTYWVGKLHSR